MMKYLKDTCYGLGKNSQNKVRQNLKGLVFNNPIKTATYSLQKLSELYKLEQFSCHVGWKSSLLDICMYSQQNPKRTSMGDI